jgi:hypothetical protein
MSDEKKIELRKILARGYCHKINEKKTLDYNLIEAMAQEFENVVCDIIFLNNYPYQEVTNSDSISDNEIIM